MNPPEEQAFPLPGATGIHGMTYHEWLVGHVASGAWSASRRDTSMPALAHLAGKPEEAVVLAFDIADAICAEYEKRAAGGITELLTKDDRRRQEINRSHRNEMADRERRMLDIIDRLAPPPVAL